MLVVAVAWPLGSAGSWCATMHPAAPSPGQGRRPAWRSRACLRATPSRLAQLFWLLSQVHGVVSHSSLSPPCASEFRPLFFDLDFKEAIDRWRAGEPHKPSRSEAIRWLIGQGLHVELKRRQK